MASNTLAKQSASPPPVKLAAYAALASKAKQFDAPAFMEAAKYLGEGAEVSVDEAMCDRWVDGVMVMIKASDTMVREWLALQARQSCMHYCITLYSNSNCKL